MKIKNGELKFVSDWLLNNLSLAGKKNRMRMKFLELLAVKQQEFARYHQQIINEHARKDENDNVIVINKDGQEIADIIDMEAFNKDYMELALEEVVINEDEQNCEMLISVKDCLENCLTEWQGQDAIVHEMICKLFDDIYKGEGDKNEGNN